MFFKKMVIFSALTMSMALTLYSNANSNEENYNGFAKKEIQGVLLSEKEMEETLGKNPAVIGAVVAGAVIGAGSSVVNDATTGEGFDLGRVNVGNAVVGGVAGAATGGVGGSAVRGTIVAAGTIGGLNSIRSGAASSGGGSCQSCHKMK